MTRFLSRDLEDPRCGAYNLETERLFTYHQATKHTFHSVRANAHFLDWKNQPDPFRTYEGAPNIELPPEPGFPKTGTFAVISALAEPASLAGGYAVENGESIPLDRIWLSRLLWHSMAISAWKKVSQTGNRYSLRVNPSSGNLHPTETYVALLDFQGLGDGLYHYRADRHAIELRSPGAWTQHLARALKIPLSAEPSLIVGLTSIFWREAWKYRDRAYRYCCHDLGHAMMSILLAAQALGLPGSAITYFADSHLTRALGLIGGDQAPMAFLVFPSKRASTQSPASPGEVFTGIPNELSAEEVVYELLLDIHRATILPDSAGAPLVGSEQPSITGHLQKPDRDTPLETIVRRRRSALDFDPHTSPMQRHEAEQILDFATRDWPADWRGHFHDQATSLAKDINFVTLYLYVHRVHDCEPGVYQWDLHSRSLKLLHPGNVQRVAAYLSLDQSLAGNACFAVSMIADLAAAAQVFGNRGYRYVHFEAGAIGQRLYLGAEALHWNATGIGAFYDDDVHRYLGFLEEGDNLDSRMLPQQVIYHFAVGRAIPDPRIEA
jgi:SagB-type dehydrogenase family enzyme